MRTTAPGPELALLAACAPMRPDERQTRRLEAAAAHDIAWQRLVRLAHVHRMVPLLYHHVAAGVLHPSPAAHREIVVSARVFAQRSLKLAAELATLLRVFSDHGLRAVPFKGPVLASQLYESPAARQMDDLDILVGECDMDRVRELLESRGYRRHRLWPAAFDRLADAQAHHLSMIDARGHIVVELHSRLSSEPGLRQAATLTVLAPHLEVGTFLGREVPVLRPELLVVYLGVHGAGHGWSRLGWLATFAELARSGHVRDWREVRESAARWGVWRHVQAGLHLADELFGDDLTARINEISGSDPAVRRANHLLLRGLHSRPEAPLTEAGRLRYLLYLDRGVKARLRRCWRTLITPHAPDAMALPLPEPFWPALAVFRPIRLMARRIASMVRAGGAG